MNGKRLIGLYPGTFDPVTLGHLDIIKRAVKLVDHLVIGVATNAPKNPMFTLDERVAMVKTEAEKARRPCHPRSPVLRQPAGQIRRPGRRLGDHPRPARRVGL